MVNAHTFYAIAVMALITALLRFLPEKLRFLNDYRMLVYAIVLILVMLATNNIGTAACLTMVSGRLSSSCFRISNIGWRSSTSMDSASTA